MNRRALLGGAAAALATTLWPAWLREAFGEPCEGDPKKRGERDKMASVTLVTAAFRRAKKAGRRLLVLVIPADDGAKYDRGHAFGELLNHGSDAELAPLADVEVVCATMAELGLVAPNELTSEPLFALVDTARVPATVTGLDAALPDYPSDREVDFEQGQRNDDAVSRRRIGLLAGLLRSHLGAPVGDVRERAEDVRARLVKKPPPGTHWANASGCGTHVEDVEEQMAIGCGMGHVPEKSRRFLYFFVPGSRLF